MEDDRVMNLKEVERNCRIVTRCMAWHLHGESEGKHEKPQDIGSYVRDLNSGPSK